MPGENAVASDGKKCQTRGCDKDAKLQCPTCMKLEITDGTQWFCAQECFKSFWDEHKKVHVAKRASDAPYNPWPEFRFTGTLRPFPLSARRYVPENIERPDYVHHPLGISLGEQDAKHDAKIVVLSDEEIEAMRVSARLGRKTMDTVAAAIEPGVTTDELDRIVHETAIDNDCYPSPLGYRGFPKSVCTSVNECICHGIPDLRPLKNSDICNVDITVFHRGFHGDLNETFLVGDQVDDESIRLIRTAYECISDAIKIVKPGVKYRDIGGVIEKIARGHGHSVVKTYCGHGIHRLFHTAPNVPHYAMPWYEIVGCQALEYFLPGITQNRATGVMQRGHCFTIEPMINAGQWTDTQWPDKWTAVTADGKRSAQFEQTLLCTDTGVDILTLRPTENGRPWFIDQLIKYKYAQAKEYL